MLNRIPKWGLLAASVMVLIPATAGATPFSGDPIADGWALFGNSLTTGASYSGGAPNNGNNGDGAANFNLYYSAGTVSSQFLTACGATCSAWQVGDKIIGLGAVFPAVVGGGVQNNAAAALLKWGVTASAYSLSTFAAPLGNGRRDHNNGDGGLGSVFATLNLPGASNVYSPTTLFEWNGTIGNPGIDLQISAPDYVAINARLAFSGGPFLSFEGYLNQTLLNTQTAANFLYNGNSIIGVQDAGNVALQTNALVGVPEPATGLLAAGALLAGWLVRRRRQA